MEQLTAATKKRITKDWGSCFPRLGARKPMSLLKRNGPILIGVYLERGSDKDRYYPTFHVHCLLTPATDIALCLCYPLADERWAHLRQPVRLKDHEAQHQAAAARLRTQVPLLEKAEVSVRELVGAYADFLLSGRDPAICHYPSSLFLDVVLLSYWAGFEDYATDLLTFARKSMSTWPARVIDAGRWAEYVESMMDRGRLETTVVQEIEKHRLKGLPVYDLTVGDAPSPFWEQWASLEKTGTFGPPMASA